MNLNSLLILLLVLNKKKVVVKRIKKKKKDIPEPCDDFTETLTVSQKKNYKCLLIDMYLYIQADERLLVFYLLLVAHGFFHFHFIINQC